ncbi:MAG TPA: tRNA (adenosine(37)-N6)-dimethylallyltransferase MiaA [Candidatus Eisenbacteria bacterium]|jgi:tRNA dimethylallyltransferase|nr:tRNA (adenosine(37)-N6)-dimethylallyltransferase MiaA [Candidatus Eisenbacteria bacterium]
MMSLPTLVAIVGPTASGKSSLGIFLTKEFSGEVIACDSTQLYRGFDIGTAKPTLTERQSVPHHLLDILEPADVSTAGGYRERAIAILADLRARQRLPVFTVGTGLYLRALLEGLADLPQRSEEIRERLRAAAAEHGQGYLHKMLGHLDPQAAKQIATADEQKLIRAIEICLLSGRPLTEVHGAARTPLPGWGVVKIGLEPPRDSLYQRIHERTDSMLGAGWLDEVHRLLSSGQPENAKPFDFIGYRELRSHLRGELTLEQARAAIQQGTRQYAKRQLTWFRREPGVHWLPGFGDDPHIQSASRDLLRLRLSASC